MRSVVSVTAALLALLCPCEASFSRKFDHGLKNREVIISISPRIRNNIEFDCNNKALAGCVVKRGIYKKYFEVISRSLNVTFIIMSSSAFGSTGFQFANGTWIGTVADVVYGNAELGVAAQTFRRYGVVRFTAPISCEFLTFVTAKPEVLFTWKALVCPFSPTLWASSLWALLLVVAFLSLLTSKKFGLASVNNQRTFISMSEVMLFCVGSFLEEPVKISNRMAARVMCAFWLFFAINLSVAYRAKLLPCLGFPSQREPPKSFEELVTSEYCWSFVSYGGAALNYLKASDNPTFKQLHEGMAVETDMKNCLQKCQTEPRACVGYRTLIDVTIYSDFSDKYGQHDFSISPAVTFSIAVGLIMQKSDEQLAWALDGIVHSIQSSGLPLLWEKEDFYYLKNKRASTTSDNTKESSENAVVVLRFEQMTGAIYIGLIGGIFAILVFSCEVSIYIKFHQQNREGKVQIQKEIVSVVTISDGILSLP